MMKKVFVAGHNGMVGSAIYRSLRQNNDISVITCTRNEVDFTNQLQVREFFSDNYIDEIYLAAAKVGGLQANNNFPADFIYENLMIEANVIHSAHLCGVQKLLFLGSSCIYPKFAHQPIKENELLTGGLEPTNEPYAIAKIAGIKLCESYNRQYGRDYRSVMPTNLYGPYDNFHLESSHVLPALIRRFHEAKIQKKPIVEAWGTGTPMREFLYVEDMAEASIFVMNLDKSLYQNHTSPMLSHINVGTGQDCSIRDLTELVAKIIGYQGDIVWDTSKPDGTPRKLLDVTCLSNLGWKYKTPLEVGIKKTYEWFLLNQDSYRK
ncbi:GDP-L-fucose synthase [Avibacterium paragallinarum]|uniref:GDP-L-fucose synthase n=1 Tax=Avibacterium paragallinarum TaxID=728 RepID=UPI00397B9479